MANTLKYFSSVLVGVLKDVQSIPLDMLCSEEQDAARIAMFPSLDYEGLFNVLVQILDILPNVVSGMQALGQTLLHTLCCLIPFLEHELMDTLPYVVSTSMAVLPPTLHKDLLDMLCYNLLPFTLKRTDLEKEGGINEALLKVSPQQDNDDLDLNYANVSVSSVIMMVLLYTDVPAYYTQLIETLMRIKPDISDDLFCVIAHGTVKARCPAVELLFQYWPELNPSSVDRKALQQKHVSWIPLTCQHENCSSSALTNEGVKMCLDHNLAIGSGDRPPPMLICIDCADGLYRGRDRNTVMDILLPVEEIAYTCESKTCKSPMAAKVSLFTCFSSECTNYNANKPVRYCKTCHDTKHASPDSKFLTKHVVQATIKSPWKMDQETQAYFVEAIISLLKEAQPLVDGKGKDVGGSVPGSSAEKARGLGGALPTDESNECMALEERQLMSRYGVWLITSLCLPDDETPDEVLGRLLAMLFQWFHCTACLPDDQAGSALERLKGECIHGWLMKVIKSHFQVFAACLLPHPVDFAKVGGNWDCWPSQTNQIKEGFKRLLCLVPYDIITLEVWSHIMPFWMECFRHEVPEEELAELKILLSKVLDPDLSPLGFTSKQMYQFIAIRLDNTTTPVQEQALYWIQMLTMLEVPVPIKILLPMLESAQKSLSVTNRNECPYSTIGKVVTHVAGSESSKRLRSESEAKLTPDVGPAGSASTATSDEDLAVHCYILMLDILVKQMELQEVKGHKGLDTKDAQPVLILLRDTLKSRWSGTHTCGELRLDLDPEAGSVQCLYCELCAIWFQLALSLIEYFAPLVEITMTDAAADPMPSNVLATAPKSANKDISAEPSSGQDSQGADGAVLSVEVINEVRQSSDPVTNIAVQDDAHATSSVVTEQDNCTATCDISEDTVHDSKNTEELKTTNNVTDQADGGQFWYTSQGKFKFDVEELPTDLQLFFVLLNELEKYKDADILYHILASLKLMCLHGEVLNKAATVHRGFLIWCQEHLLVRNLWTLLQAEFSQISQLAVPLLLHCITLPSGRDMFLKLVELDFNDKNWRARFTAVERVTTIAHFLEPSAVKNAASLQSSLAAAFCYLVHCLDDIESTVAQRALLNLETIKATSLRLLVWCLETQFDLVLIDRPMILQTVFQLYNHLSDRRFLTWDFFLNRFDTLFIEAQVILEQAGELAYTRDLKNTNVNSEIYRKKILRVQEALNQVHVSRSLSATFGPKLPYKRAMSAPTSGMIVRTEQVAAVKCPRQSSAPVIPNPRRKSSKLAAMGFGSAQGAGQPGSIPDKFASHFTSGFSDGDRKEQAAEEQHIINVVHRMMASNELTDDQELSSIHLITTLLMQFLSRPDHSHPSEEKAMQRNQLIVLRHLNLLLGYCPAEKVSGQDTSLLLTD